MKLFSDEDDGGDSAGDISKIEINHECARRSEHNKKCEDLQRFEELKKKGIIDSDDDSSEDDYSSKQDLKFFDALIKVRNRDPILKNNNAKLFDDSDTDTDNDKDNEIDDNDDVSKKKKKKMYLKDVTAMHLIENAPEFEEVGEDKKMSYKEGQEALRKEFLDAVEKEKEEDGGEFLKVKDGTEDEESEDGTEDEESEDGTEDEESEDEEEEERQEDYDEYRQKIVSNYQPLYKELYTMNPSMFFVPSFLKAFDANDKERDLSIKSIMSEPTPGVYTFDMLQPRFCEMLLSEVENFEKWVHETKFRIMRPNTMNNFGAILDDFGMEGTLDKLMEDFIRHISKIYFPDVGGYSLDSHHGFVVEYGLDRDLDLGFHVDDSEVTLNVCLGKQFTGGELFFRGVRCDKHVNGETYPEENFDYSHVPGRALIHRGRHRHGAKPTTSGHRINLLLWCKSSVHRELKKHKKDFLNYCGECKREKKGRLLHFMAARKKELLVGEGEASS